RQLETLGVERAVLEDMLKDMKRKDDILPKLMTSTGSFEDLFRKEIAKYDHICEDIAHNIDAQEQLLMQIQARNEDFAAIFFGIFDMRIGLYHYYRSKIYLLVRSGKYKADQRRGRTGRTCDGRVYRLVTGSFFSQFEDYEPPSILRLSLRQQVLQICCATSKAINNPKDPPRPEVVEDVLNLLVHMRTLEKTSPRGRYEPTFYGRMLASFSLSFDASVLILLDTLGC
uniref:RNA helicase n=1 Tax=Cannabis sativa TaxID=3483 RepID=A0A803QRE8_CANSA